MDVIEITPQHIADEAPEAHAFMALLAEHLREQYPGKRPSLETASQAHAAGVLLVFMVVNEEQRPVGYCMAMVTSNLLDGQKTMQIVSEFVLPEYRGSKARAHLVQEVKQKAQNIGCDWLAIERNAKEGEADVSPWQGMKKASVVWRMEV